MVNEVLYCLGFVKIVSVGVEEVEKIKSLLSCKTLYVEKYNHPTLTKKLKNISRLNKINVAECVGGPYCLEFFNRVFYYEWKNK